MDLADATFELSRVNSASTWSWDEPIKLLWTDPPFGTGKTQRQGGAHYLDTDKYLARVSTVSAIRNASRCFSDDTVVCVCADDRILPHVTVALENMGLHHQGDIIWTFGLGRPRSTWWPRRHNTVATFTVTQKPPKFNADAVPRERRLAPKPGYPDDRPAGSVWDFTMSNTDPQRVGYPNQKPMELIRPFIEAHTDLGDWVADPFMGSGATGVAALQLGRRFMGQDTSPIACETAEKSLRSSLRVIP